MSRGEFLDIRDAQQSHGSEELVRQNVETALDTVLASCHQTVQVCPADQGAARTHRDACDDISTRHDSSIDQNLEIATYLLDYFRQQVERAIELTTSVVGQD